MNVYSVDIPVWATTDIKAENEEQALEKLKKLGAACLELQTTDWAEPDDEVEVHVSAVRFDDPALPELSLSPAMTISADGIHKITAGQLELRE